MDTSTATLNHPSGGRSLACELLMGSGADEGLEQRTICCYFETTRSHLTDEPGEHGIRSGAWTERTQISDDTL